MGERGGVGGKKDGRGVGNFDGPASPAGMEETNESCDMTPPRFLCVRREEPNVPDLEDSKDTCDKLAKKPMLLTELFAAAGKDILSNLVVFVFAAGVSGQSCTIDSPGMMTGEVWRRYAGCSLSKGLGGIWIVPASSIFDSLSAIRFASCSLSSFASFFSLSGSSTSSAGTNSG